MKGVVPLKGQRNNLYLGVHNSGNNTVLLMYRVNYNGWAGERKEGREGREEEGRGELPCVYLLSTMGIIFYV